MAQKRKEFFTPIARQLRLVKIRHEDGTFETVRQIDLTPEQRKQADLTATNMLRHLISNRILSRSKKIKWSPVL